MIETRFEDVLQNAIKIAEHSKKLNLDQSSVIAVLSPNSPNLLPIVVGAFFQATPIFSIPMSSDNETIKHYLKITQPKLIFVHPDRVEDIRFCVRELSAVNTIIVNTDDELKSLFGQIAPMDFKPEPLDIDSEYSAALVLSERGGENLKPIRISHKCLQTGTHGDFNPEDTLLCHGDLSMLKEIQQIVTTLKTGSKRIITDKPFSGKYLLELAVNQKATHIMSTVDQLKSVIEAIDPNNPPDLSHVKSYLVYGGTVPPNLGDQMDKYLQNTKISVEYGFTESEFARCVNRTRSTHPLSVGKPDANSKFKIMNKDLEAPKDNGDGTIYLRRADKVFGGYYKDPTATRAALDMSGFICTGDIGHFDHEGYLYLK